MDSRHQAAVAALRSEQRGIDGLPVLLHVDAHRLAESVCADRARARNESVLDDLQRGPPLDDIDQLRVVAARIDACLVRDIERKGNAAAAAERLEQERVE